MKPTWLIEAEKELGVCEIAGPKAEARILLYWQDVGLDPAKHAPDGDETPWCAVFAGAMLVRAGLATSHFTLAKQFLGYGQKLSAPIDGCIVILNRPGGTSWQGHVGFCVGADAHSVALLGGNQGNAVGIAVFAKDRVAGFRWPLGVPLPEHTDLSSLPVRAAVNPNDR